LRSEIVLFRQDYLTESSADYWTSTVLTHPVPRVLTGQGSGRVFNLQIEKEGKEKLCLESFRGSHRGRVLLFSVDSLLQGYLSFAAKWFSLANSRSSN